MDEILALLAVKVVFDGIVGVEVVFLASSLWSAQYPAASRGSGEAIGFLSDVSAFPARFSSSWLDSAFVVICGLWSHRVVPPVLRGLQPLLERSLRGSCFVHSRLCLSMTDLPFLCVHEPGLRPAL